MSKAKNRAVVCAVFWAACWYMYTVALDRGLVFWACVHAITGAWAAALVGWNAAMATQESRRNRRRRAMQGWEQLSLKHRKGTRA